MDLAALLLSIFAVALGVLALPTVFQMFAGRPRLRIRFDRTPINGHVSLRCNVWNVPIENKFLRLLGVTRDGTEVSAHYSIEKYGSREIVKPLVRPVIATLRERGEQVSLVVHPQPAIIAIFRIAGDGSASVVLGAERIEAIPPGGYVVKITLTTPHGLARREQVAIIGERIDGSYWREQ